MKSIIRKLHRQVGLVFSISILMASGSGVIHVIMTRTQAPPPSARPSGPLLDLSSITITPAQAFPKTAPSAINIRNIGGKPHYQALVPGQQAFTYIDATTGLENPQADETHASEIASAFLANRNVQRADYLTAYDSEYIPIFRILPVYRFNLTDNNGTRVYVSTATGSVTRHTDNQKQFEASVFTNFHKLGFIPNKDVRDWTQILFATAAFIISLLGIVLFFLTRPKGKQLMKKC